MKNQEQIPIQGTKKESNQNQNTKEEDVFVREKIDKVKKLNEELNNKVYTKEEIKSNQNQKKEKKEKIGMKLMLANTIIASFIIIIIVFHLKGYF